MKRITGIIMAMALLLSLAACAPKNGNNGGEHPAETPPLNTQEALPAETAEPVSSAPPAADTARPKLMKGQAEYEQYEDGDILGSVEWDNLILSEESALEFPELAAALKEINLGQEQYAAEQIKVLRESAEQLREDGITGISCTESIDYYVYRCDEKIVSILEEIASYYGGVHPSSAYVAVNLDPTDGKKIMLSEVVNDVEQVKALLATELEKKYGEALYDGYAEWLAEYSEDMLIWTLDSRGISFYFSPYELAPYATGLVSITFFFDEHPLIFREEFVPEAGEYSARELLPWTYHEVDCSPGDGSRDELYVYLDYVDEYGLRKVAIEFNDITLTDNVFCYECDFTLVDAGGRLFIYAESVYDDVQHTFSVYELSGSGISCVGKLSAGAVGKYDGSIGDYGVRFTDILTDPEAFELETWVSVILRDAVKRGYRAGENGMPVPETEYYEYYEYAAEYGSIVPLTVEILPEGVKEELPVGTYFKPLRTDGVSYIDMRLDDGRECRMAVDTDSQPNRINGISVDECFGGLGPQW